ncbi:hypothetical protein EWM64_g8361 [Hericium alpestre]|uniref:D-lactate dehydrogenase (cytochrome) n=1 Tax=Hericium alpestre TaxID=135208 RepID=A0A4Y9ZP90_9AGAM|nr:hypothetical protein EWM64_g8361 [Hericium alpestre]
MHSAGDNVHRIKVDEKEEICITTHSNGGLIVSQLLPDRVLWSLPKQGDRLWTTDVCVPVSKLPELVYKTQKDMNEHGVTATIVGHVGDGNFHSFMLFHDDKELEKLSLTSSAKQMCSAQRVSGTGEHGVGLGKKEYLVGELGEGTVELMRSIKQTIDPLNIMNPGKVTLIHVLILMHVTMLIMIALLVVSSAEPSEVADKAVTRDKAV